MHAQERFALSVFAALAVGGRLVAAQSLDRRQLEQVEQTLRREGQAVVELADAAARNETVPSDFALFWHNDFLKAQSGTFVPFVVSIMPARPGAPAALLYVRAARRRRVDAESTRSPRRGHDGAEFVIHPFEEIYPVDLPPSAREPLRFTRGFSLAPGDYDITVVVRERERADERGRKRMAAVLRQPLTVPDFTGTELMTSSVIVADRLTVLSGGRSPGDLQDRPYVIAGREIQPVLERTFGRSDELIVVFLVYNPSVTEDKLFDLEVEYHFFRRGGMGEAYVNRTEPQRFTPASLGPQFDPMAGQPVLAGQGVPLAGFEAGEYRLAIKVTDRTSGRSVSRDVTFRVRP